MRSWARKATTPTAPAAPTGGGRAGQAPTEKGIAHEQPAHRRRRRRWSARCRSRRSARMAATAAPPSTAETMPSHLAACRGRATPAAAQHEEHARARERQRDREVHRRPLAQEEEREHHRPDREGVVEERRLAGRDPLDGQEVEQRRDPAEAPRATSSPRRTRPEGPGPQAEERERPPRARPRSGRA